MRKMYRLNHKSSEVIYGEIPKFSYSLNLYIVDKNVFELHQTFFNEINSNDIYFFDASEGNKSFFEVQKIIEWLKNKNFNRSGTMWGIGGGITLDITGFVASIFMRGCKLNFIPTTLLAMVDAALGGKTAVNLSNIKNMIGTFYPAEKIYIEPNFLTTLSSTELKEGWSEIIKISLIQESNLYEEILQSNLKVSDDIIQKAISLKMEICERDPEDRAERNLLNLGHTFAHIIESISQFEISHGNAVAIGIESAALLSLRSRWISKEVFEKIMFPWRKFKLIRKKKLINYMKNFDENLIYKDKKMSQQINLILFNGFQSTFKTNFKKNHLIKEILLDITKNEV
ncbi:MAG: 3-dehydroquinate synthase [Candidatus Cloacimonetes bacterium]|nr:3-dehydroquinate synthase [Candidatus Cloacimonadota bacterium]